MSFKGGMEYGSPTTATSISQSVARSSLVCKANVIYSRQESARILELRVRTLHSQLSEQAKGESAQRGEVPPSVVTMVHPLPSDDDKCEAPPSVTGSSFSTLSSTGSSVTQRPTSGLPRTMSMRQLPMEGDGSLQSGAFQQGTSEMVETNGWGFFVDHVRAESLAETPKTIYSRFMSYFMGSRSAAMNC